MAYNPIFVTTSFLNPLFFKGLLKGLGGLLYR